MTVPHVVIAGSGIAGPMAAVVHALSGFKVDVYEKRDASELTSDGILGITDQNWAIIKALTGTVPEGELPNNYTTDDGTTTSPMHYITWRDLHNYLTGVAEIAGVVFHYGTPYTKKLSKWADLVINATGITSASEVSVPVFSGYVIWRGSVPFHTGWNWRVKYWNTETGRSMIAIGDTNNGASVTMFIPRDEVAEFRTTVSETPPFEVSELPEEFYSVVGGVEEWQTTPMSDWSVPSRMMTSTPLGMPTVRIGDALGQLRPSTSMGANLALQEALQSSLAADFPAIERPLLVTRAQWAFYGLVNGL